MLQLPVCTYTSLSLTALESQDVTDACISTAWNRAKSSDNILIYDKDPTKLYRQHIPLSTDIAITDTGFAKGIHILEVEWQRWMRGTHAVIGAALEGTPNHVTQIFLGESLLIKSCNVLDKTALIPDSNKYSVVVI